MGSSTWRTLQALIDSNNSRQPQRSASDWMNSATHQFLKFSLRCWKHRNSTVHGATKQEQRQIALKNARERITNIYENPPSLAPQFRSIFAIPLAHRLKLPLQMAEQWISMIMHQATATSHNFKILMKQHKPIQTHFRTMRREARQQAKDRRLPASPRKAHSRAVQREVKLMRAKLYSSQQKRQRPANRKRVSRAHQSGQDSSATTQASSSRHFHLSTDEIPSLCPPLRYHPP
mmetsp:Transcript_749/g.1134  ORF Transcript_749/g.1134 Transcript_749/m.1134 type:complete len:233 (+) Transcript_749:1648-2346(+)